MYSFGSADNTLTHTETQRHRVVVSLSSLSTDRCSQTVGEYHTVEKRRRWGSINNQAGDTCAGVVVVAAPVDLLFCTFLVVLLAENQLTKIAEQSTEQSPPPPVPLAFRERERAEPPPPLPPSAPQCKIDGRLIRYARSRSMTVSTPPFYPLPSTLSPSLSLSIM